MARERLVRRRISAEEFLIFPVGPTIVVVDWTGGRPLPDVRP